MGLLSLFVKALGNRCFFFGVNCVDFSFKLDILAASSGQSQTSSVSMPFGRAHLARHSAGVGGSSLGALLRKRKVTGRDASLPAPCLSFLFELVVRETVGALPQTPQGTLSLDSARGRRKGTKSPLDPFARLRWSHSLNSSACGFFILPPPLPQVPAASPANPHSPSQSAHSGRAASSLPPPAIHTASAPRRRADRCWSRSFHPADALR